MNSRGRNEIPQNIHTPPRTHFIRGIKSGGLKIDIFYLNMMVKSGIEFFLFWNDNVKTQGFGPLIKLVLASVYMN